MTANHEFSTNADMTLLSLGSYYSELILALAFLAGFILCSSERLRVTLEWFVPTKNARAPSSKMLEDDDEKEKDVFPLVERQQAEEKEKESSDMTFECDECPNANPKESLSFKSTFELVLNKTESVDPFFNEALAAAAQLPAPSEDIMHSLFAASAPEEVEESGSFWALHGASVEEALCQWHNLENSEDADGHLLGGVVEVCLAAGAVDEAFEVARESCWNVPQSPAGQKTLLRFIEAVAERGNLSRAYEAYSNLHANGLEMDLKMYDAMLATAARAADIEKLERIFTDLMDAEIRPEYVTFSTVVRGYCAAGSLDKAMALFSTMREHGIAPSQALFNALLTCCAQKHMVVLAEQILQDMTDSGVHPSSSTVTTFVRLYGHARDLQKAFWVATELSAKYKIELAGDTYGALIAASLLNNQLDSALGVFEDMPSEGCVLPARTYGVLITACLRDGDLGTAVELVNSACAFNCDGQQPRARLERNLLEDVLRLIGRRKESATLGAPLVHRLMAANIEISEDLAASILREAERPVPASRFHARRSVHDSWRSVL
jgi:pentatricopeptide repeat protein